MNKLRLLPSTILFSFNIIQKASYLNFSTKNEVLRLSLKYVKNQRQFNTFSVLRSIKECCIILIRTLRLFKTLEPSSKNKILRFAPYNKINEQQTRKLYYVI